MTENHYSVLRSHLASVPHLCARCSFCNLSHYCCCNQRFRSTWVWRLLVLKRKEMFTAVPTLQVRAGELLSEGRALDETKAQAGHPYELTMTGLSRWISGTASRRRRMDSLVDFSEYSVFNSSRGKVSPSRASRSAISSRKLLEAEVEATEASNLVILLVPDKLEQNCLSMVERTGCR